MNCFETYAQKYKYDLYAEGFKIGELVASKTLKDETVLYTVESTCKVNLIKEFKIGYILNAIYKNGNLQESTVKTFTNGDYHSSTKTVFTENKKVYEVTKKDDTYTVKDNITYTGALLYYKEPVNINRIYSEVFGAFSDITKLDEHFYQIKHPKEDKNSFYRYKNGKLIKIIVKNSLLDFELRLVE